MIDLSKFWVQDGDVWRLVVGGVQIGLARPAASPGKYTYGALTPSPDCYGFRDSIEAAKSAAEQAVSEWLYPVLQAVLGEPVAWAVMHHDGELRELLYGPCKHGRNTVRLYALPERTHES